MKAWLFACILSVAVGDVFNGNWEGVALGDLFDRIRVSMPEDAPGSLSRQQNVDVVAYLLKAGQFPAGDKELVTESNALAQMKSVSNRRSRRGECT